MWLGTLQYNVGPDKDIRNLSMGGGGDLDTLTYVDYMCVVCAYAEWVNSQ